MTQFIKKPLDVMKKPTVEEIQELIDNLREGLGYASYDIDPVVNRPTDLELMKEIQSEVIGDLKDLSELAELLDTKFKALSDPTLKPLSELHNDEEACKDLLCFVFGYQNVDRSQLEVINHNFKTEISDYSNKISIWHDGAFYKYGKGSTIVKIFQIVDFIRSLGYNVQPETKTP